MFASGEKADFDEARPVFSALAAKVYHVGADDSAAYLKLVHSLIVGVYSSMIGEALAFGERGGLDLETMVDILEAGPLGSRQLTLKAPILKARDFDDPPSDIDTAAKDVDLILGTAKRDDMPLPLTSAVRKMMATAQEAGQGKRDIYAILETFERLSGGTRAMSVPTLVRLPGTDLDVSRICLGGNRFGAQLDQEASFELLDIFHEAGGNFVDTAHVYADWLPDIERSSSEKTIGRWLAARGLRGKVVVATKGGHPELGNPASRRLDRASLREDATGSRDNLGTEDVPIFYVHRDDPGRPVDEILGALEELRGEGIIRHYAASNWTLPRLVEARRVAQRAGWQGFVANQPEWSLARRNPGSAAARPGRHGRRNVRLASGDRHRADTLLRAGPRILQQGGWRQDRPCDRGGL